MRKKISLLLVFFMLFTMLPMASFAEEGGVYEISDAMAGTSIGQFNNLPVYKIEISAEYDGFSILVTEQYKNVYATIDQSGPSYETNVYTSPIERDSEPYTTAKTEFESNKANFSFVDQSEDNEYALFTLASPGPPIPPLFGDPKGFLIIEWAKPSTDNTGGSVSEYDIVFDATGVTTGCRALDTTTIKFTDSIEFNRTYILSFTNDQFKITNNTTKAIARTNIYKVDKTTPTGTMTFAGSGPNITRDSAFLKGEGVGYNFTNKSLLTGLGYPEDILDNDATEYYYLYLHNTAGNIELHFAILIEITPNGSAPIIIDKISLQSAIDNVPMSGYYTNGDNFNGSEHSTNGFWADMQAALTTAKTVNADDFADQGKVDETTEALTNAIDKLIPKENVNATSLYEEIELQKTKNEDLFTTASWADFTSVLNDAKSMLTSLYVQEGEDKGKPTELNIAKAGDDDPPGAIYQTAVDSKTDDLKAAAAALKVATTDKDAETANITVNSIVNLYNFTAGLSSSDYTSGWEAFQTARSAAYAYYTENGKVAADSDAEIPKEYNRLYQAFYDAYYYGLTNKAASINVSVRTADNLALKNEKSLDSQWQHYHNEQLTLTSDHTVNGLLSALNMSSVDSNTLAIFVNGVLIRDWNDAFNEVGFLNAKDNKYKNIILRDGDEIVLARLPQGDGTYYITTLTAPLRYTKDFLALARFDNANGLPLGLDTMTVREGETFTLYASKTAAAMDSYSNKRTLMPNATLFVSKNGVGGDDSNAALPPTVNTGVVTDLSGKAELSLYGEGWFQVFAVDLRKDSYSEDVYGNVDSGTMFPTLTVGASIWVYVEPLDGSDLSSAVAKVKKELEDYHAVLNKKAFTDQQWQSATESYESAIGTISTAASLTDARNACDTAIGEIDALLAEIDKNDKDILNKLTTTLGWLPDMSGIANGNFTKYYIERFSDVKALYERLTDYQKEQLNGIQEQQYQALLAAYGTDGSGLPDAKDYKIMVKADNNAEEFDVFYKQYYTRSYNGGNIDERNKSAVDYDFTGSSTFDFIPGGAVTIHIAPVLSDIMDAESYSDDYYITSIEVDGVDARVSNSPSRAVLPSYDDIDRVRQISGYVMLSLPTPDNDITITLSIRKAGEETLDDKKEQAKSALAAVYAGYDKALYTNTAWAELTLAYNTGLSNISAATDENGIDTAKGNAQAAMLAIKTRDKENPATGGAYGSVRVTVENTTYGGGAFNGIFVDQMIPLNADTTMMTALLDALEKSSYKWSDSSGRSDKDISYLSRIYSDENNNGQYDKSSEPGLAEFDGGPMSGWMGLLNDWFVNEGFQSFAAGASKKDYRLVDGDHIAIKYTSTGYGSDLGGTWGNADTSLKRLSISGGKLMPDFNSSTRNYFVMMTGGSSLTVDLEAFNKNYQVRTYLNETSGDNWYRKSESINVKKGDVIQVGVGDRSWPSMNNQGAESISYSGTWYSLTIIDGTSSEAVISLINSLTNTTYSNYKAQKEKVVLARAAYEALNNNAKDAVSNYKKLTDAEDAIKRFTEIDNVKALLAAIPEANKLITADKNKVEAARAAYDKLSDEQKLYITVGDVTKYNAAVEWLEKQGVKIEGGAISGSAKMPEGTNTTVIQQETVISGNSATAKIAAESVTDAIKAALDTSSNSITIIPTDTGNAGDISVELPTASAKEIANDTNAALVIETNNGSVTIPNAALAEITKAASGSMLEINVSVKTAADVTTSLDQKMLDDAVIVAVSIKSGNKNISDFAGKEITVSLPVKDDYKAGESYKVIVISSDGKVEELIGKCVMHDGKLMVDVKITHLSTFIVTKESSTINVSFTDVSAADWFYDAVVFAVENGLFKGTSESTFSPNEAMTRGMLVSVLHRLAGEPAGYKSSFTDVNENDWFAGPVAWAAANNVVSGYGQGLFGPNDKVTREQIAAILHRYAQSKGYELTKTKDLSAYKDAGSISPWAKEVLAWANAEGLINGRSADLLAPGESATRAEVAAILQRFIENVMK